MNITIMLVLVLPRIYVHWPSPEDRLGKYSDRDMPDYSSRNFEERGFTVGIGGLVVFHLEAIELPLTLLLVQ